jgi:nucleotide-binding universal stress UspA family protein
MIGGELLRSRDLDRDRDPYTWPHNSSRGGASPGARARTARERGDETVKMIEMAAMHWLVGLDLHDQGRGAVQMAAWLRAHLQPATERSFVGVHVLEEHRKHGAPSQAVDAWLATFEDVAQRLGTQFGGPLDELSAVWAHAPEEGLTSAVQTSSPTGVIIGRVAPRDGRSFVRLGRVARRLLRTLPAPIMVVPPDLSCSEIGRGPVVLATDLGPSSVAAGALARDLAASIERELLVAHVDDTLQYVSAIAPEAVIPMATLPHRTRDDVAAWASEHRLDGAKAHVVDGQSSSSILALAHARDAPLVVCGSRRLSLAERIFTSSTGTDMARLADRAVLVVPPNLAAPASP